MSKIYASLISGGKDSVYATYLAIKNRLNVVYGINVIPRRDDSYMFHYPNAHLAPVITEAIGLRPIVVEVSGVKEKEVDELKSFLIDLNIDGIVAGAIASKYQKTRLEKICDDLGLEMYVPLWGCDPVDHLRNIISDGFRVMIIGVYGLGLEGLLGKIIDENVLEKLIEVNRHFGTHVAGEGGEFETLVLDGPIFKKKLVIEDYEVMKGLNWGCIRVKSYKVLEK
ncbi:MAG: diphthine--ammonia ligase [Thermoplasmata archaeon]|nr:diphthine--ammonia ligase [Euryarchaeota archaeon]RLF66966.1 MAG: diphthine--ammonia ligase [Thermoplasmata archaeon]